MNISRQKACLLVALVAVLAFAITLRNGFSGDDRLLFLANDFYQDPSNITRVFSSGFTTTQADLGGGSSPEAARSFSGAVAYRPVTVLSFFIDAGLWGRNASGYHFDNLLLHVVVSCAVFFLLLRLQIPLTAAVLGASLFAAHPVHAETINTIGYRSDILAALFYTLTLAWFLAWRRSPSIVLGIWTLCAFILGLLSKETVATLPILILVHEFFIGDRPERRTGGMLAAMAAALGGYLYLYVVVFPNPHLPSWEFFEPLRQVLLAVKILSHYVVMLVLPAGIGALPSFYAPDPTLLLLKDILLVGLLVAASGALMVRAPRGPRYLALLTLWFWLTLLPAANLIPLPNPMAYRYLYLPSVGFLAVFAYFLDRGIVAVSLRSSQRTLKPALYLLAVGLFVSITLPLNVHYRNDVTLNHKIIEKYPGSFHPYLILGSIYRESGKYAEAAEAFRMYLRNRPDRILFPFSVRPAAEILHQIGTCYPEQPEEAAGYFERAVELSPGFARARADLGRALMLQGKFVRAEEQILRALSLDPDLFPAYVYGIDMYLKTGEAGEARRLIDRARKAFPAEPVWTVQEQQLERMTGQSDDE